MTLPRQEKFVLDIRRAARLSQKPTVSADSHRTATDPIAQVLQSAALWLTPKTVTHYESGDFAAWPQPLQEELNLAVDAFRSIAHSVDPDRATTQTQFTQGRESFVRLMEVIRAGLVDDWKRSVDQLLTQTENWGAEQKWRTRRETKKMEESLLGEYELQQLYLYTESQLYMLVPVARFVPGAAGAFDLTIQPSYYVTSLYRYFDTNWYVHLEAGEKGGSSYLWEKEVFIKALEELRSLV